MSEPLLLACLEGAPAPPELARDLKSIGALQGDVQAGLWKAVEAVLVDPPPADAGAIIEAHAQRLGVEPAQLSRAASSMRAVYRFAAALDLPREVLGDDLAKLSGNDPVVSTLVLSNYELARQRIHAELAHKTLMDHGKVLTDVSWRLNMVTQSNHGRGLRLPVVTLTLQYQEQGQKRSITLEVLPSILRKLKETVAAIVS